MQESFLCFLIPQNKKQKLETRNYHKNMEKKAYIEPSMLVKKVNLLLMQDGASLPKDDEGGNELEEGDILGKEQFETHDVWED